jgi:hypothetical protein
MSISNNSVFKGLHIVAWIIFIGLCIEAGGLIINFIFSIYNPDLVGNLYQKLDLREVYARSTWAYFCIFSLILTIAILKAHLFYVVIRLVSTIDLEKPFNKSVSKQISSISYYTFAVGIFCYLGRQSAHNLLHKGSEFNNVSHFWSDYQAFILMAAVIYVIASIFKRGIEIQSDNELTI